MDIVDNIPKNAPNDYDEHDEIANIAKRLAPRNHIGMPREGGPKVALKADTQITYSRTIEGLHKLIERMREVRGMSDVVRESLTRDVPKDELEVEGRAPTALGEQKLPAFEHIAQLTIALSREIERAEKNMALALAVLK